MASKTFFADIKQFKHRVAQACKRFAEGIYCIPPTAERTKR
jgi:hypothetical protein